MSGPESNVVWNVPNQLTGVRLLLAAAVCVLLPLELYLAAGIAFALAAGTDYLDGWWARRYGQVTKLGRILDPFVDKVLICGVFILLAVAMADQIWGVAGWMAVVVVARELLVTALRGLVEERGGDFSAKFAGKLKMLFQCLAALFCLGLLSAEREWKLPAPQWVLGVCFASVWLAVLSTIYSGAGYVVAAARALRE